MIKQNTVFILGAGSARPYLLPTGDKLKSDICKSFVEEYQLLPVPEGWDNEDIVDINSERARIAKKFTTALQKATRQSIDLFLKINDSFSMIGKIAILQFIFKAENLSRFRRGKEDWYSYLFERMMIDCNKTGSPEVIKDNKVSFITFNYDRSLEYFLADSFVNCFSDLREKVRLLEYINHFPFCHIYGSLGRLPWQKSNNIKTINYGIDIQEYGPYILKKSTLKNIKLIGERKELEKENIAKLINRAEKIFFLGFSYAEENLEALGLPENLNKKKKIQIYGTKIDLHYEREREVIQHLSSSSPTPIIQFLNINSYELVKTYLWD